MQDSFPLTERLQKVAGDEKRRLQPPEGSPLDRDDLLEQFERELEENLACAAAPVDLTGEDDNQQVASAEGRAPLQEGDQEQQSGDGKVPADKKEKDEKDQKEDDLWSILPHRHDELTAAEVRWWDVKDQFWKEKVTELQDVEVRTSPLRCQFRAGIPER